MNIYIQNHQEITRTTIRENGKEKLADVGVALDVFEKNHGLKHDAKARAEYIQKYAPDSLSVRDKELLGLL